MTEKQLHPHPQRWTPATGTHDRGLPEDPDPTPAADAADRALLLKLTPWLNRAHLGSNKRAAEAIRRWCATKGL